MEPGTSGSVTRNSDYYTTEVVSIEANIKTKIILISYSQSLMSEDWACIIHGILKTTGKY
jgi:hypothetical protein